MFEAVALKNKVDEESYEQDELELRQRLLQAQRNARSNELQTIVIVSGVEGAGKSQVVNRLRQWLDPRGVRVSPFWEVSDEEEERPEHYRYFQAMPARGTIGIFFGGWYVAPVAQSLLGKKRRSELEAELERINSLERALSDDGALIVKLWFHIDKRGQKRRISKKKREVGRKATPLEREFAKRYDEYLDIAETMIRHTDTGHAPWELIDAEDARYRDLKAGHLLLEAIEKRLEASVPAPRPARSLVVNMPGEHKTVLDTVDLSSSLDKKEYEERSKQAQARLFDLAWRAREQRRSLVALFEGWDAAGKGGAIRRVADAVDARMLSVIPIAAPTDEERKQHYLWRFWRQVPRDGSFTIFDRSWYGRVLVERVEGFASESEWGRAYQEINDFEHQLAEHKIPIVKFWLHISPEEQLKRFQDRQATAYKNYKITPDDWRNRENRLGYEQAVDEMVRRTSTRYAPWTLVAANDKRFARVAVIEAVADALESTLR